ADVAVNPDSELIPVTRANGVLVAHVTPLTGQGGLIRRILCAHGIGWLD
ncbi:MAG: amidohydrolase, partial [Planctomycetes bacterium]|nr:amidohydrolase [Planctomycetota bacterium]